MEGSEVGLLHRTPPWLAAPYLSLLPALSEDLPVVAVAGVLQAEEPPVAQPRVRRVRLQHAQPHHAVLARPQRAQLAALRAARPPALRLLGLHHRGDDVVQEVGQAGLQLVTLDEQTGRRLSERFLLVASPSFSGITLSPLLKLVFSL